MLRNRFDEAHAPNHEHSRTNNNNNTTTTNSSSSSSLGPGAPRSHFKTPLLRSSVLNPNLGLHATALTSRSCFIGAGFRGTAERTSQSCTAVRRREGDEGKVWGECWRCKRYEKRVSAARRHKDTRNQDESDSTCSSPPPPTPQFPPVRRCYSRPLRL